MRHRSSILASILMFLAVGCSAQQHKPATFTVLTYNIHHAAGEDQKLDLPRIADVIQKTNADFVALQEVDCKTTRTGHVDQAAELGKLTGMHSAFGKAMDFMGGQYGEAVLSRYPIKSSRVIDLPWTDQNKHEPRAALVTRVKTPAGDVVFVSTHLDHTGKPNDRIAQIEALAADLEKEKEPTILAGDFNCTPESEPLRRLAEEWTRATDDVPSNPSVDPKVKIDHVFLKPSARWTTIETHVVPDEIASDHRPVVAKVELRR